MSLQTEPAATGVGGSTELAALVAAHMGAMLIYARRLAGNEADAADIVQDVMLKLCRRPEQIEGIDGARAWLMRVVFNQFIDFRRRHAARVSASSAPCDPDRDEDGVDDLPCEEDGPQELIERAQLQSIVGRAIESLPESQRSVVHLHDIQGLSLIEISRLRRISINTLKSALTRGRSALRYRLGVASQPLPVRAPSRHFGTRRRRRRLAGAEARACESA